MRKIVISLFFLLGGSFSQAAPSLWVQNFLWKELASVLVSRCQAYTPDQNHGCYYATTALIGELKKDVSKNSIKELPQMGVVFKPELLQLLQDSHTAPVLDMWQEEIQMASALKQWDFSLFDMTANFLGSDEKALQLFAVLLQDITSGRKGMFKWLQAQPMTPDLDVIEKWMTVLDTIQNLPTESKRIFYPSAVWASASPFFNTAFYHFYVPAYLHAKIRNQKHVTPEYSATAVFLFNYIYENIQENGIIRATFTEPREMKAERNLNDIRLAYLASAWYEHRGDLPAFYAQTAFLKLKDARLKGSLKLWIERLQTAY